MFHRQNKNITEITHSPIGAVNTYSAQSTPVQYSADTLGGVCCELGELGRVCQPRCGRPRGLATAMECPKTFKHGDKVGDLHEVTIEDWWLEKNPFVKPVPKAQRGFTF